MSRLTKNYIIKQVEEITKDLEDTFENYEATKNRKYIGRMFDLHGRRTVLLGLIGSSFAHDFIKRSFDYELMMQILNEL